MGNIVLLDDLTINKIAAGEVIERPASVIKEMVENSIDAGATNITVEIKNGGISYIRVSDNGKGIASDDLEIAFERHATSKIRSADDLETVTSMGFRGEALASIAAIANVELISKTEFQEIGYRVVVEGGNVLEKEEAGCSKGTSITVRNLFFNTPVRYKFLKKDFTESGYIEDVITRIALVHPEIAIKFINTGKTVIQTNGNGDLKTVIYSIYGKDISEEILNVDYTYEDITVRGVVGKPIIARSNRSNQIFFVNNRHIKDKTLSSATEQAFKGMLPIGKFGFLVLNIGMNPSKVDVNVHPAKLEVRFEEENKVFKAVYHAIKDTLLKGDLVRNTEKTYEEDSPVKELIEKRNIVNNNFKTETSNINFGQPMNTEDVLKKLRELQNQIKKDVENNPEIKLTEEYKNSISTNNSFELKEQENDNNEEIKNEENQIQQNETEIIEKEQIPEIKKNEKIKETKNEINNEEIINKEDEEVLVNNEVQQVEDISKNYIENIFMARNENSYHNEENNETEKSELQINEEKVEYFGQKNSFNEMYLKTFGRLPEENKEENEIKDMSKAENISMFADLIQYQKPMYKFLGIAFNTYIILEIENEMYILDQHAAHERIMYEKVKANYYNDENKDSQMLLLPDIITLTHKEMNIVKENMRMFEKAGFVLEEFGENTIKLSGVPNICFDLETKELFLETLDEINTVAVTAKKEIEEKFLATVACKAAVKANMVLAREEVEALLDKLLELQNPFTCPHGRPTAIKMSKIDIEKKFARR